MWLDLILYTTNPIQKGKIIFYFFVVPAGHGSYIEMNPVRAKLVKDPTHWRWSSAFAHTNAGEDKLTKTQSLIQLVDKDWAKFLSESITAKMRSRLQKHERTGRPAGNIQFIEKLEKSLGVTLKLKKPGRKPKK